MDNSTRGHTLLAWSLGTFHAGFFLVSLVSLLYWRGVLGGLLGSLNTLVGFALFGALWLTTWWSTRQALRSILSTAGLEPKHLILRGEGDPQLNGSRLLVKGALWGGINGVLFLLLLLIGLLIFAIANTIRDPASPASFVTLLIIGIAGLIIAFLVGFVAGLLLALIDGLILSLAGSILARLPGHDR